MLRQSRRFFLWIILAGLALRLFFFIYFPAVTDDSQVYLDLANNWLRHGVYGQTQSGQVVPTDARLPGYPAFLSVVFMVFGAGNIRPVLLVQILLDLLTCVLIADLVRRTIPTHRAGRVAFALAALCPFLANYAAAVLTETLETFLTALALDCAVAALDRMNIAKDASGEAQESVASTGSAMWLWAATGVAIGACILVRPDGGILLAAVLLYLPILAWKCRADKPLTSSDADNQPKSRRREPRSNSRTIAFAALTVALVALALLVPWTLRNFRTLHHFQPLAPRYANESEELAPVGFNRWVKTWIVDYVSVEEIYWNVPGAQIDATKLPARALDQPPPSDVTLALIASYNQTPGQPLTPQMDAQFGDLAVQCIRARPVHYYVTLPLLRIADMWLRPRTELLPPDIRWWEFNDDPKESALAVGFGLLNLAYVAAAFAALFRRRSAIRYLVLLVGFVLLRSAFLGTLANPEPRYTLECYPIVIVLAASFFAGRRRPKVAPRESKGF